MIITNGYLILIGGDNDGKELECCYQENSRSPLYSADGQYISANYTALVECQPIEADGATLLDISRNSLGKFQVSNIRRADSVKGSIYVLTRYDNE